MEHNWISQNKHQLIKIVTLLLLLLACFGIAPTFYDVVTDTERTIGIWSKRVYTLLNDNTFLNIPIFLFLLYLAFELLKIMVRSTTQNHRFDWLRLINYSLSIILAFVFIKLSDSVEFANMFHGLGLDYRRFLLCLLGALLVLLVGIIVCVWQDTPLWRRRRESNDFKKDNKKGFSAEGDYKIEISPDLKDYASSIVNRLMHTSLSKESFAVGIISKWGAGKTTFLELLKNRLHFRAEVVEFNPWMCSTPEQVTRDFFTSLHNQLADKYPEISNPIKKYAKYLSSVSLRFSVLTFGFSSLFSEKSLLERKKELSDKFERLGRTIVVIIDDVDRLESNEVFEVLRLIRNTADLKNVIYLVAFDKEYVVSVLKEKHIDDPIAYLEKIFQVEIQLPLVPPQRIMSTLITELDLKIASKYGGRAKPDFQFEPKERRLILKVITTYRRAKRFARLYTLNYEHLLHNSFDNLEWRDVFWLDLLQMNDKNTYDLILCNNPSDILKPKKKNGETYYIYEDSTENQETFRDNPCTHEILLKLFGDLEEQDPPQYSIRNTKYYEKYFTMQVQFSMDNLNTLLNAKDDEIDGIANDWCKKQKQFDNLYLLVFSIQQIEKEKAEKLVKGIFALITHYNNVDYYHIGVVFGVFDIIIERGLKTKKELNEQLITWYNERIKPNCDMSRRMQIFYLLYYHQPLILEETIKQLLRDIIDYYFKNHAEASILDLKKYDNEIKIVLIGLPNKLREFAVECLIDCYSKKDQKPTIKKFEEAPMDVGCAFSSWEYKDIFQKKLQLIEEKCCSDGQKAIE